MPGGILRAGLRAGAGGRVVGDVEYGDYPPAAWASSSPPAAISRLRAMGLRVYVSETHRIANVAGELERVGKMAGTEAVANTAAAAFRERHASLAARYSRQSPVVVEAVIAANPEGIFASGMGESRPGWLDDWRRWTTLTAVARDNLYFVPPDLLQRHTPRILDGVEKLCTHLETARGKRGK